MRFLIIVFFIFLLGCNGSSEKMTELEEEVTEAYISESYITEDDEDVIDYYVEVIENEEEVKEVKEQVDNLNFLHQQKNQNEQSIGRRYVAGEVELADEITDILLGSDSDKKEGLFWDLNPWDKPEFKVRDPKLISAIFSNIYEYKYEVSAINLMVDQKLPGYHDVLEKHLMSGVSTHEGELFMQLGSVGVSMKALNFIEKKLKREEVNRKFLANVIQGLSEFKENGNETIGKKAKDIIQFIYEKRLVEQEDLDAAFDSFDYSNPGMHLLTFLFEHGDETILPLARKYKNSDVHREEAFNCLIRLNDSGLEKDLVSLMKDENTYSTATSLIPVFYKRTQDDRILHSAITNFEKHHPKGQYMNWELETLIKKLVDAAGDSAQVVITSSFENTNTLNDALKVCSIEKMTAEDIANYFLEKGLIDEAINQQKLRSEVENGWGDPIYDVLEVSGIYFWYDTEDTSPIAQYEDLVDYYKNNSRGKLTTLSLGIDNYNDGDQETEFVAVYGTKAYRMFTPEKEDWDYRYFEEIRYFINFILSDSGADEAFHLIDYDGYIFGDSTRIEMLKEDFGL